MTKEHFFGFIVLIKLLYHAILSGKYLAKCYRYVLTITIYKAWRHVNNWVSAVIQNPLQACMQKSTCSTLFSETRCLAFRNLIYHRRHRCGQIEPAVHGADTTWSFFGRYLVYHLIVVLLRTGHKINGPRVRRALPRTRMKMAVKMNRFIRPNNK
jgi:hypothetical protein